MANATILFNGLANDTATWLAVLPNSKTPETTWIISTANGKGLLIVDKGA